MNEATCEVRSWCSPESEASSVIPFLSSGTQLGHAPWSPSWDVRWSLIGIEPWSKAPMHFVLLGPLDHSNMVYIITTFNLQMRKQTWSQSHWGEMLKAVAPRQLQIYSTRIASAFGCNLWEGILNYTPENMHSHAYTVKAKFLQKNALTNVIHSDIFLFNFKKILIATTDWKTALSDIQIFLHNFPARIVFALRFENERVVAFFCQSSQCLSPCEVSQSGEQGSFLELRSGSTEWSGHSSSEREWTAFTGAKAIPTWKPGRVRQETVKRPVNALSCQDHHTVPPKIRQRTDVG